MRLLVELQDTAANTIQNQSQLNFIVLNQQNHGGQMP